MSHQDLYKSPRNILNALKATTKSSDNATNQSPDLNDAWRNAYKKRCFDELRKSRQKLVNKFRNFKVNNQNLCYHF